MDIKTASAERLIRGKDLTSHDLVKTYFVLCMVLDHVGYYFYPEITWLRVIAHWGTPLVFFLIGHSKSNAVPLEVWVMAIFLVLLKWWDTGTILAFDALVTIIACRYLLKDFVKEDILNNKYKLYFVWLMCFVLSFILGIVTDYSTVALLMAMVGYMVRNGYNKQSHKIFIVLVWLACVFYHMIYMNFTWVQTLVLAIGQGVVFYFIMMKFKKHTFKNTGNYPIVSWLSRLCGRRMLHVYVAHLVILILLSHLITML